ncbi:MAG TPA: LuxR C-terminal-related transcriptional regulator [Gemmatimonadales bacterium]|nr:LuxR C-terminal-related transcriptional regulator [Gemmatimonadales bacterium]
MSQQQELPAVQLLKNNPRIFWGKVIQVLIQRGWRPPPPDERIVDELLEAMEMWKDSASRVAFDADEAVESFSLLTQREAQVAQLVALGHSNPEIAKTLGIGEQTVKFHLTNAYRKLGVKTRAQLALTLVAAKTTNDR